MYKSLLFCTLPILECVCVNDDSLLDSARKFIENVSQEIIGSSSNKDNLINIANKYFDTDSMVKFVFRGISKDDIPAANKALQSHIGGVYSDFLVDLANYTCEIEKTMNPSLEDNTMVTVNTQFKSIEDSNSSVPVVWTLRKVSNSFLITDIAINDLSMKRALKEQVDEKRVHTSNISDLIKAIERTEG